MSCGAGRRDSPSNEGICPRGRRCKPDLAAELRLLSGPAHPSPEHARSRHRRAPRGRRDQVRPEPAPAVPRNTGGGPGTNEHQSPTGPGPGAGRPPGRGSGPARAGYRARTGAAKGGGWSGRGGGCGLEPGAIGWVVEERMVGDGAPPRWDAPCCGPAAGRLRAGCGPAAGRLRADCGAGCGELRGARAALRVWEGRRRGSASAGGHARRAAAPRRGRRVGGGDTVRGRQPAPRGSCPAAAAGRCGGTSGAESATPRPRRRRRPRPAAREGTRRICLSPCPLSAPIPVGATAGWRTSAGAPGRPCGNWRRSARWAAQARRRARRRARTSSEACRLAAVPGRRPGVQEELPVRGRPSRAPWRRRRVGRMDPACTRMLERGRRRAGPGRSPAAGSAGDWAASSRRRTSPEPGVRAHPRGSRRCQTWPTRNDCPDALTPEPAGDESTPRMRAPTRRGCAWRGARARDATPFRVGLG
jgi:hypothetical protein